MQYYTILVFHTRTCECFQKRLKTTAITVYATNVINVLLFVEFNYKKEMFC